jgi:hypothetical protein
MLVSAGRDPLWWLHSYVLRFRVFSAGGGRRICLSGEALAMRWLCASLGGGERLELCVGGRAEILAVAHGTRKLKYKG